MLFQIQIIIKGGYKMKKILFCLCAVVMLLCGCENGNQDKVIELDTPVELETKTESEDETVGMETSFEKESTLDILLSVKSANANSLELEISNNSSKTLYWGSWFTLEKKENDNWYEVKLLDLESDNIARTWTDSLAYLNKDETRTIECKWDNGYGELSNGNYRIVKEFFFDERNQDEKVYVACEFSIE